MSSGGNSSSVQSFLIITIKVYIEKIQRKSVQYYKVIQIMCEPCMAYIYMNLEICVMVQGASFQDFESKRQKLLSTTFTAIQCPSLRPTNPLMKFGSIFLLIMQPSKLGFGIPKCSFRIYLLLIHLHCFFTLFSAYMSTLTSQSPPRTCLKFSFVSFYNLLQMSFIQEVVNCCLPIRLLIAHKPQQLLKIPCFSKYIYQV